MPDADASNSADNNKWLPDLITAFRAAGGEAGLPQIYRWIESNRPLLPTEWKSVVRASIYAYCSDAKAFRPGNPDVFAQKGRGFFALRHPSETIQGRSHNDMFIHVITKMSPEELKTYAGRGDALVIHVQTEVAALKKRFNMEG